MRTRTRGRNCDTCTVLDRNNTGIATSSGAARSSSPAVDIATIAAIAAIRGFATAAAFSASAGDPAKAARSTAASETDAAICQNKDAVRPIPTRLNKGIRTVQDAHRTGAAAGANTSGATYTTFGRSCFAAITAGESRSPVAAFAAISGNATGAARPSGSAGTISSGSSYKYTVRGCANGFD